MRKVLKVSIALTIVFAGIICTALCAFFGAVIFFRLNYFYFLETCPDSQWGTVWVSEDNSMILSIDEQGDGMITFKQNECEIKCNFYTVRHEKVATMRSLEVTGDVDDIWFYPAVETWRYTKVKKDTFTIRVEETTFRQVGEIITFHKKKG